MRSCPIKREENIQFGEDFLLGRLFDREKGNIKEILLGRVEEDNT